jgi:MinD-like ATPase involved in chromosome partitioning or flagellar assembly
MPTSTFVFSGDPLRGAIHTCRRADEDLRESADATVGRCFDSLARGSDQIMVDAGLNRFCRLSHERVGSSVQLQVLVPDTRCLAALKRAEEMVNTVRSEETSSPLLILNQFDASDPLHTEVRSRLLNRFPGRLVPVQIRRDRSIPAALAEGMTVIDYAPESNAAEDFVRLDQWLRANHLEAPFSELSQKVQVL